jgi:hypothetical protein
MSGAEPLAVLGAISSVIAIVEASKEIYEAARNLQGLHETFRKVSDNIPIILSTLHQAELLQKQAVEAHKESNDAARKHIIEEESRAVEPIMSLCRTNAETLSGIFASIIPNHKASQVRRYANAVRNSMPGKKQKVQHILRETLESLQLLHTYHSFNTMTTMGQLQVATRQFSGSLPPLEVAANHLPVKQQTRTTNTNVEPTVQPIYGRWSDSEAIKSNCEKTKAPDKGVRNVWTNADGTRVMNQIATQTVYGGQNFTL